MNDYIEKDLRYRKVLANAWVAMGILVLSMYATDLLSGAVANDFKRFSSDPGPGGALIMGILFTLYAFLPVLVREFDWLSFRWFVCIVTIYVTCFFFVHQLSHIMKSSDFAVRYIVDVGHHLMGLWASYASIRWLRCGIMLRRSERYSVETESNGVTS